MNLLIFLDLAIILVKSSNFTLTRGKLSEFLLFFAYNQGKIFLILPITRGGHMYTLPLLIVCPLPRIKLSGGYNSIQTYGAKLTYPEFPFKTEACIKQRQLRTERMVTIVSNLCVVLSIKLFWEYF